MKFDIKNTFLPAIGICILLAFSLPSIGVAEESKIRSIDMPYTISFAQTGYVDYLRDSNYQPTENVRTQYWAVYPQLTFIENETIEERINEKLESFAIAISGYRALQKASYEMNDNNPRWMEYQGDNRWSEGVMRGYYTNVVPTMGVTEQSMLSVCFDMAYFAGGVHQVNTLYPYTLDVKTGDVITIKTLVEDASAFQAMVESFLLNEMKTKAQENPYYYGNNYGKPIHEWPIEQGYFTQEGYVALFNDYDLTSYADGRPSFVIPYENIFSYLNAYGREILSFIWNSEQSLGSLPYLNEVLSAAAKYNLSEEDIVYNYIFDYSPEAWRFQGITVDYEKRPLSSTKADSTGFVYEIYDYSVYLLSYVGDDTHVVIPDYIHGLPVVSMGSHFWPIQNGGYEDWYFGGEASVRSDIKSIVLPDTLRHIAPDAFYHCWDLESLVIPKNVSELVGAFVNCPKLIIDVDDENPYYTVKDQVVYSKDGTKLVYYPPSSTTKHFAIPEGVTDIERYAFAFTGNLFYSYDIEGQRYTFINTGCLETVVFPQSLRHIGENAFLECYSLINVEMNEGLDTIGAESFTGCKKLMRITIPRSVTRIELYAFIGCGLTDVVLQEGLRYIGFDAFSECPLEILAIPRSVQTPSYINFYINGDIPDPVLIPIAAWSDSYAHQKAEELGWPYTLLNSGLGETFSQNQSIIIGTVRITHTRSVNVRSGGNQDYDQIDEVYPGQEFPCIGIAPSGWYCILLPDGRSGYLSNNLTTLLVTPSS